MRPLSKAAKAEAYDALKRERDAFEEFAWHTANGIGPDAREMVEETRAGFRDGGTGEAVRRYEFALYGTERAHGGIVACIFRAPGQHAHVDVYYFEEWCRRIEAEPFGIGINTEIKIACDRLKAARSALWRAA